MLPYLHFILLFLNAIFKTIYLVSSEFLQYHKPIPVVSLDSSPRLNAVLVQPPFCTAIILIIDTSAFAFTHTHNIRRATIFKNRNCAGRQIVLRS